MPKCAIVTMLDAMLLGRYLAVGDVVLSLLWRLSRKDVGEHRSYRLAAAGFPWPTDPKTDLEEATLDCSFAALANNELANRDFLHWAAEIERHPAVACDPAPRLKFCLRLIHGVCRRRSVRQLAAIPGKVGFDSPT
ncbi:MAG: hypothetical protein AAF961_19325 [Planctomycetota bacterium]